jgi:hypothetical protein
MIGLYNKIAVFSAKARKLAASVKSKRHNILLLLYTKIIKARHGRDCTMKTSRIADNKTLDEAKTVYGDWVHECMDSAQSITSNEPYLSKFLVRDLEGIWHITIKIQRIWFKPWVYRVTRESQRIR